MWQTVRIDAHANADGLKLKMYDVYQVGKSLLAISALEKEQNPIATLSTKRAILTDEVTVSVDRELFVRHILVAPEDNLVRGPFEAIVKKYDDALLRVREAKCIYHAVDANNQLGSTFQINFARRFAVSPFAQPVGIPGLVAHGLFFNRYQAIAHANVQGVIGTLIRANNNNPKC